MLNLFCQKASVMWKALLTFVKQARRATKTGGIMIIFAVTYQNKVSTVLGEVTDPMVLLLSECLFLSL